MLYAAILAVLVTRLLPLRMLDTGLWGDSYHHTLITQLLVQRGGLFSNWAPYAPIVTFTYHFGFHTTAAVLEWVLGLGAERSVLWAGQILNALAVAGLAPLAGAVLRRLRVVDGMQQGARLAGIVAITAVGLLSPMPMFYTNWGRYTQIAGQALLLVWMGVALDIFESDEPDLRRDALGWLLLGGLGLTHYRVLIFAVLWIGAILIVRLPARGIVWGVKSLWRAGAGAALLFLPWFWIVFGGGLMDILGAQLGTPAAEVGEAVEAYSRLGDLTRFLPAVTWGLLTLVVIWGFQRREKGG